MIKVGVIGGTGYTGVELLRLLALHPEVELVAITSRGEAGVPVSDIFSNLRGQVDLKFQQPDSALFKGCDVVFSATPNGVAMTFARELLEAGIKLIDLAADFRLQDIGVWEKWYGMKHACPELVEKAVYGLPELNREQIKTADIIANPGCYPTATTLGFLPLIENELIDVSDLIADTKSGVSGAGRGTSVANLYSEVADSFKAYAVSGHRHHPEISQTLAGVAGQGVNLTFVPHLTPMLRGIHATLYANLKKQDIDLQSVYEQRYDAEPFVDVMPSGAHPETRSVKASNMCRIAVHKTSTDSSKVVILSVIDNLTKGAAGQAVQNMNIMFDKSENTGLTGIAVLP